MAKNKVTTVHTMFSSALAYFVTAVIYSHKMIVTSTKGLKRKKKNKMIKSHLKTIT